jgi:hypothetical protein
MRFYSREQWYRIPDNETVILNTNYLFGKHRFVKRTQNLKSSYDQVKSLLHHMSKDSWESWNVGTGYAWEPKSKETYFLAVSMTDGDVALQFELTFC